MNEFNKGLIVGVLIVPFSMFVSNIVYAESIPTTISVVIQEEVSSANVTAEVPCNEVNCPQEKEEVGFWGGIINWFKNLI